MNLLKAGERLSVPLTWGGTRRAAIEAERVFNRGPITRATAAFGVSQRDNPHFDRSDRRTELTARAERRFLTYLVAGATAARADIAFGGVPEPYWTAGADLTFDTRRDPAYPIDAVLLGVGWNSLQAGGRPGIGRTHLDARGFKRLFGQMVVAGRAQYDRAVAPLPAYDEWLLGGADSLRGTRAGAFAGDKRLLTSLELRVPFSSPLRVARTGFTVFADAGVVASAGQRLRDEPARQGVGAGVFLVAPFIRLNLEVARSLDTHDTRIHFGTGFAF